MDKKRERANKPKLRYSNAEPEAAPGEALAAAPSTNTHVAQDLQQLEDDLHYLDIFEVDADDGPCSNSHMLAAALESLSEEATTPMSCNVTAATAQALLLRRLPRPRRRLLRQRSLCVRRALLLRQSYRAGGYRASGLSH